MLSIMITLDATCGYNLMVFNYPMRAIVCFIISWLKPFFR